MMGAGFRLGVIEGFFGRQWSWEARSAYAAFLASTGCNTYVYAPKNDDYFRKLWQYPCPAPHLAQLQALRTEYARHGVTFGIGLSPFELYRNFSPGNRAVLRRKILEINSIAPDLLCILFDDMMGALDTLAVTQLDIVGFITELSTASSFAVCPTYYSSDPLLARHFGPQPGNYLEQLGRGLDPSIAIFWTGPKVISDGYPPEHLRAVAAQLQRKPLLWDNYPVNDARRLTPFLHLAPFSARVPDSLRSLCSGHLANPMNQAWLSRIPLWALAARYAGSKADATSLLRQSLAALCSPALADHLAEDANSFQQQGLEQMAESRKLALLHKYGEFTDPMAQEVCAWLRGEYAFDPACLT